MPLSFLWEALGGLGLFILGMKSMSEGLHSIAGEKLRRSLEKITGNRLSAALMGSCLASLLQSSSAASILVIGFVNAGLISLYQALGVLLGTGLGSTLVIQLIAFKISTIALPAIFFGIILKFFSKKRRWVNVGEVLSGVGLVFFGLQLMENGISPISRQAIFNGFHFVSMHMQLSAVLLGAILTLLIQSSSTTTGIVIALASSGVVGFETGVALIIGESLGTSCMTGIATINGTLSAKRTAYIFFIINVVAILLTLLCFPFFIKAVKFFSPGEADFAISSLNNTGTILRPNIARHLANAHTLFSFCSILIFLPLIGFFTRSATVFWAKKSDKVDIEPRAKFIDLRIVNTPSIAMLQVKNEVHRMAEVSGLMFEDVVEQFYRYDVRRANRIIDKETVLDVLHKDISNYLIILSRQTMSAEISIQIPIMLQVVDNIEHLGDQSETILSFLRKKKENKILLSSAAIAELKYLAMKIRDLVGLTIEIILGSPEGAPQDIHMLKDELLDLQQAMHASHMNRLTSGKCNVRAGLIFSDIIAAFMKIADYCFTIIETERSLLDVGTTDSSN